VGGKGIRRKLRPGVERWVRRGLETEKGRTKGRREGQGGGGGGE